MFDSEFQSSSAFLNSNRASDLISESASSIDSGIDAYGLQVDTFKKEALAPLDSSSLAVGKSVISGGDLLIQGGATSRAEINEVDDLLDSGYYNREQTTSNRQYTNYRYANGSTHALQSANESVGMDRGDSITNPIHVGTVVYRSGANIRGNIGNNSGLRDKNDYFSFRVGKSGTVDLSLFGLSKDAGLALYDSNKKLISSSDKTGTSAEKISKNLATGNYFARCLQLRRTALGAWCNQL